MMGSSDPAADFAMDVPESADERALRRVKAVAHVLDEAIPIPGTGYRVGVDPLLNVVPGAGDVVSAALSLYIIAEAAYLGVPLTTIVRMLATVAVDAAVSAVPFAGILFDAVWKANKRNADLLERCVERGRTREGRRARNSKRSGGTPIRIDVEE
jgi:hypothetical protein